MTEKNKTQTSSFPAQRLNLVSDILQQCPHLNSDEQTSIVRFFEQNNIGYEITNNLNSYARSKSVEDTYSYQKPQIHKDLTKYFPNENI